MPGIKEYARCPLPGNNRKCPLINSPICLDWRCETAQLTMRDVLEIDTDQSAPKPLQIHEGQIKGIKLG